MGWKLYAIFALVMLVSGAWGEISHVERHSGLIWFSIPISAVAEAGVIGYAFGFNWMNRPVWLTVLAAFVAVNLAGMWHSWTYHGANDVPAKVIALAIGALFALPTAYAVYAYARKLGAEHRAAKA